MGIFDNLLGKKSDTAWTPTHRGQIAGVALEDIETTLGRPTKAKGGFVFWRGDLTDLDPDYPDEYYQISNYDYRRKGEQSPRTKNREWWFVMATSARAIRLLADEVGGIARNIEEL